MAARHNAHQMAKAETVMDATDRGVTRAATSGAGGNTVNAPRQNLRPLLDSEMTRRNKGTKQGYTPDEIAALQKAVHGTKFSNTMRALGRFSPTSATLPALLTGGGVVGAASGGGPYFQIMAALGAAGAGAKPLANHATKKHIDGLLATILAGGKTPTRTYSPETRPSVLAELLKMSLGGRGNDFAEPLP